MLNLEKYWHYRYRLVNYYMVVGEGSGMSLPADIRNTNNSEEIRWGEAPVYLGYYLGVLATEYRLLKDNNQPTDRTLTELYYAILAAVRIDNVAESYPYWNHTYSPSTNGFLIRDDVPYDFLSVHPSLNLNIASSQGITFGHGTPGFVSSINSDFIGNTSGTTPKHLAVSQDVVYQLLMGLALVSKYVDDGDLAFTNYLTVQGVQINLRSMAIDEADKIVGYIKFNHLQHWEINDPDGHDVHVGGNCSFLAYAIAKSGDLITGHTYADGHSDADEPDWQILQYPEFLLCRKISDEASVHPMAMSLAAMSDAWRAPNGDNTTPDRILQNGDYEAGSDGPCLHLANHYGWDIFYGALWDVFHGGPRFISDLCKAKEILDSAPYNGPFYHSLYDKAPFHWCATRRFFDDAPRQDNGKDGFDGNYNGLDYMLLFNLYYLDSKYQQAYASTFYIPSGNLISDHYPWGNIIGDFNNPVEYDLINSPVIVNQLAVTATIGNDYYDPGHLTIKSGPQGTLLTNTTVEYGAYLYVAPLGCNPPQSSWYFDPSMFQRIANPNLNIDENVSSDVTLFPNPSTTSITITLPPLENTEPLIQIYNSQGKIVFQEKNISKQNVTVVVSEFAPGIYFVRITDDNTVFIKKFIRE